MRRGSILLSSCSMDYQKEVLSGPCRRHPVRSLRVFGSVARGEASQGSDLDLLVQFEDMPSAEYATHYFGLLHELQDAVGT